MLKSLFLFVLGALCFGVHDLHAQNLAGKWYGIGYIQLEGSSDSYMAELVLKQDGNQVKGEFNYYFKDKLFKHKFDGSYDKNSRVFTINKIPIIFYRSNDTKRPVESIMSGSFELRVSKVASVMNGLLISSPENVYIVPNIKYRFLRSMGNPIDTSIEEPEPLLSYQEPNQIINSADQTAILNIKNPADLTYQQTIAANATIKNKLTNTASKNNKPVIQKQAQMNKAIVSASAINSPTEANQTKTITTPTSLPNTAAVNNTIAIPNINNAITNESLASSTKSIPLIETRKKAYFKEIELDNGKIQVEVYDNGTIDYDSVSLYLNGKEVLFKTMLNHKSVKLTLQLNPDLEFNELGMFAENLGMIPPNTAAMIIHDGKKEYQVLLQSDFSKSATIKLKVRKNNP